MWSEISSKLFPYVGPSVVVVPSLQKFYACEGELGLLGKGKSPEVGCFEFIVWLTRHGTMHAAAAATAVVPAPSGGGRAAPLEIAKNRKHRIRPSIDSVALVGQRFLLADTTTKTQTFRILFQ